MASNPIASAVFPSEKFRNKTFLWQYTVWIVVSIFMGGFVAVVPWWLVIAFAILPVVGILAIKFPELGVVIILLLISGLVPSAFTPQIPLGPGKILSSDLVIILLFCIVGVKFISGQNSRIPKNLFEWNKPILALLFLAVIGAIVGAVIYKSPIKDVFQEFRVQLNWLVCFLVCLLVRKEVQLTRLIWGVVILGLLLSFAVIAQFITGQSFIESARVESLNTLNATYSDVTRSSAGGSIYIILVSIFYLLARMLTKTISTIISVPFLGILAAAVVVSFGRGIWITTLLSSLVVAGLLLGSKGIVKVSIMLVIAASLALFGLATVKPQIISVAYERLASTTDEGAKKSSLGWRLEEAAFASDKLLTSPVFGVGFGSPYKPFIYMTGTELDYGLTRYIHNSFLGVWLKMGLFGLVVVFWIYKLLIFGGLRLIKITDRPKTKALAVACLAGFISPAITSMTQPEWLTPTGVAFFALILGLFSTIDEIIKQEVVINHG